MILDDFTHIIMIFNDENDEVVPLLVVVCEGMRLFADALSFVRFSIVFPCFLIRERMFPRIWCPKRDLNSQPTDYKSVALPIELLGH